MSHCRSLQRRRIASIALIVGLVATSMEVQAAIIWNGPMITFTRPDNVDDTLPENQDRLTPQVWLTRGNTHGLFNIVSQPSYSNPGAAGTEWAYGTTANYATLTYGLWLLWNGMNPQGSLNTSAVLHLIAEDIYIDIKLTSWTARGGGGFSYTRSTPQCSYSLSPKDLSNVAAAGGPANIVVTTPNGCPVPTNIFQPWISVASKITVGNTTTVQLQIGSNVGAAPRATAIQVADRLFLITQAGP